MTRSVTWESAMFDLIYILGGAAFFALCWVFTKACDKL